MASVLEDIRVLDLTRLLPGAICTMILADMGAEIIKIEDPGPGDYARLTPPLVDGMGAFFRASNRGKRSIVIDLKQERGRAVLHDLVKQADVVVEGFRPGVTARLGCDYETLLTVNPKIVYASLSGWGQTGPHAEMSGHDLNYVSLSGLQGASRTPQPLGGQIADVGGAYSAVMGICAALFQRERRGTGTYIDVSLFEASMPFAMYQWVESVVAGLPGGQGSLTGGMAFYNIYTSSDGQAMALAPIETKFWQNFCNAVNRPEWLPLHNDLAAQPQLKQEIAVLFASRPAAEWETLLKDADCCFTRITDPAQLIHDPQIKARQMAGIDSSGVPWMRSPVLIGDQPEILPAPAQGEHTHLILRQLGYSDAQIAELEAAGVTVRR